MSEAAQTPKLVDLSNHDWGVTPHAAKSPRVVITNAHEKAVVKRGRRLNEVAAAAEGRPTAANLELLRRLEAKWAQAAQQLADIDRADLDFQRHVHAELASM